MGRHASTDSRINREKRDRYQGDPQFRGKQQQYSRDTYRLRNPRKPRPVVHDASLAAEKEITADGMEEPQVVRVFTMAKAAAYLNCTLVTFRKWVADGLVPKPILYDTSHGYAHYSEGEMQVIARVLDKHREEFDYYLMSHTNTVHQMFQAIQGYRASNL